MNYFTRKIGVASVNLGLLFSIYFAHFNSGMTAVLQGGLIPFLRAEYGLTYAEGGLLLSSHQIGNLGAVLLVGVLPFWLGRKKTALFLGSGIIVGFIIIALTGNFFMLVVAYVLTGVSRGTMSNINTGVVSDITTNRASGLSLLNAFFAFGAVLAPLLLVAGNLVPAGWRTAPYVVAVAAFTAFIFLARSGLSNKPVVKDKGGSFAFLKTTNFWLNAGILFCYLAAEATIIGWFQVYFADTGLLPQNIANITPMLLWFMMLLGRLSCAAVPENVNKKKLSLFLGASFAVLFVVIIATNNAVVGVVGLFGIGLSMAGIYPLTIAATNNTSSNTVTGTLMAFAMLGATLMPGIVGAAADEFGLRTGLSTVIVPLLIMIVLLIIKNIKRR